MGTGGREPGCSASLLASLRDRAALCQLWRAIILRDDAAMKTHAEALGVRGEAGCAGAGA